MGHPDLRLLIKTTLTVYFFVAFSHCESNCFLKFRDKYVLDCGHSNITRVPQKSLGHQIQALNLHYNKISIIRSHDFIYYRYLEKLDLRGNTIQRIEENAFGGLPRLRKLDLSKNYIRIIHPNSWGEVASTLTRLSISMNSLTRIPVLTNMTRLKYLNVSYNTILRTVDADHLPTGLIELDLHYTGIKHFSESTFKRLRKLKKLHLQDMISSSSLTFDNGVFDALTSLRYLDLSRTFCKKLPTDSFRTLTNLQILRMKNCWIAKMPELFAKLQANQTIYRFFNPKLKELDLSNNRRLVMYDGQRFPSSLKILSLAKVKLREIDLNIFHDMKKLQKLDIRLSRVVNIDKDAFQDLESLQEVYISENLFESAPSFPQSLRSLNVTSTRLKTVSVKMMHQLRFATEVNMSNNEIEKIELSSFRNMTSLRILDLSHNKILSIKENFSSVHHGRFGKGTLGSLVNLEVLNLHDNRLTYLEYDVFENLGKLEILDLSENMLRAVEYETLRPLKSLKKLDLSENELVSFRIVKFPELMFLDLSSNKLQKFPDWKENKLLSFKASQNMFQNLTVGSLKGLRDLEEVYLSENEINLIHYKLFEETPILRILDLSGNKIDKFLDFRIPNLEDLRLSGNELTKFEEKLEAVSPLLRKLQLNVNRISFIDPIVFEGVFSLTMIDLSWNMFVCDCQLTPFVQWIEENRDIAVDVDTYVCTDFSTIIDTVGRLNCDSTDEYNEREMNDASESNMCVCIDA